MYHQTLACFDLHWQLSSWNPTRVLPEGLVLLQLLHLAVSTIVVAVSATRQLISNSYDVSKFSSMNGTRPPLIHSPLDHLAKAGPFVCLAVISVDVLLRVLRLSIYLAAGHLVYLKTVGILTLISVIQFIFLMGVHRPSSGTLHLRRNSSTDGYGTYQRLSQQQSSSGETSSRTSATEVFLQDCVNPFLFLLSPWCMFTTVATRAYFSMRLFAIVGVIDTLVFTAFYASPLVGYSFFNNCPVDVFGLCDTDTLASSCFPVGFAVTFMSVWAASTVLWCWAGWVMHTSWNRTLAEEARE